MGGYAREREFASVATPLIPGKVVMQTDPVDATQTA